MFSLGGKRRGKNHNNNRTLPFSAQGSALTCVCVDEFLFDAMPLGACLMVWDSRSALLF